MKICTTAKEIIEHMESLQDETLRLSASSGWRFLATVFRLTTLSIPTPMPVSPFLIL